MSIPLSARDLTDALFVRRNLLAELVEAIQGGDSVKLVGVPEIGITTVMRRLAALCTAGAELSQEFVAIYLAGRYDGDRVRSEIVRQLTAAGFAVENMPDRYLQETLEAARRIVAGKRLLLICDDFEKNFARARPGSILTAENLTDIRGLVEDRSRGIQFVVNYTHPLKRRAGDDYYLNNLNTFFVELLTLEEARDLIARRKAVENRGLTADGERAALRYGGRHPLLLDEAARRALGGDLGGSRDWARRHYGGILQYIDEFAMAAAGKEQGAAALLRGIAHRPMREDQVTARDFDLAGFDLARRYCYEEKGEDGSVRYRVFAEGFADYLREGAAKRMVMLVHGIRTRADWQEEVKVALEESSQIRVFPLKYGYFDVVRFLLPLKSLRGRPVERIYKQYRVLARDGPGVPISVIAHSYGTYIVGRLLELKFDAEFERIVLCASVLPADFEWERYTGTGRRLKAVVNDCSWLDVWPVLAESASWGYGSSGTFGFGTASVVDRFYRTGHSELLNADHARRYWRPFIEEGEVVSAPLAGAPSRPWYWSLFLVPLKWVMVVGLALMLAALGYQLSRRDGRAVAPRGVAATLPAASSK
jgi:hypothetical protein